MSSMPPPSQATAPGAGPHSSFTLDFAADPHFAPTGGRRARRGPRRRGRAHKRAALIISAVLAGVGLAAFVQKGSLPSAIAERLPPSHDVAQAVGLGLDQVAITGHRFTSDEAIFKALDLAGTRTLTQFDPKAARQKLEALPWVASAELSRVYPGQLNVRISERTPFALWRHEGREQLIDKTGRVLQAVTAGSVTHLPIVAGEDAPREAHTLMVLLSRYQPLNQAYGWAERVNGRRWSVHLKSGGRIELPPDGEALALSQLEAGGNLGTLMSGPPMVVDLRAGGRIAVRPVDPKAAGAPHQRNLAGIGSLIERIDADGGER